MSQVTIYLPEQVERDVRRAAKRAGKTLSAYITSVLDASTPGARRKGFARLFGSMPDLELPDDADLAPLDEP